MTEYIVSWHIVLKASSPEEAARLALEIQRDKDSVAQKFAVKEVGGEDYEVDLLNEVTTNKSSGDSVRINIPGWRKS